MDFQPDFFRTIPIPQAFHNSLEEAPFRECLMCGRDLMEGSVPYMIEKAIRRHPEFGVHDTVFEMAICAYCGMEQQSALSEESQEQIMLYLETSLDLDRRLAQLDLEAESPDIQDWIGRCAIYDTDQTASEHFQIFATCQGDKMILNQFPWMIGGKALEEMSSLLSKETLGGMDDFMGKHFGLPPELQGLPLFF